MDLASAERSEAKRYLSKEDQASAASPLAPNLRPRTRRHIGPQLAATTDANGWPAAKPEAATPMGAGEAAAEATRSSQLEEVAPGRTGGEEGNRGQDCYERPAGKQPEQLHHQQPSPHLLAALGEQLIARRRLDSMGLASGGPQEHWSQLNQHNATNPHHNHNHNQFAQVTSTTSPAAGPQRALFNFRPEQATPGGPLDLAALSQFANLHNLSAVASALQRQQLELTGRGQFGLAGQQPKPALQHHHHHHHHNHNHNHHQLGPRAVPGSDLCTNPPRRRRAGFRKCRKRYGMAQRGLWCTQCRWKKACSRFTAQGPGGLPAPIR